MERQTFSEVLQNWYHRNKRDLPWRNTKDPYKIWLSEVILQQTRVVQGLPYYLKFVEKYPAVMDLASADEKEVLRLWQGLGYYSRARNMHKTAKIITSELNGKFPETYAGLVKLKGIGPYTAAAIASFAFDEKVAVVDGNVYRVLARIFGLETDIASHEAKKIFGDLANELISDTTPGTHNQAMMEFGATYCTPASPGCMFCIFHYDCEANAKGKQAVLPVKSKKVKVKSRYFDYFVIEQSGKLMMSQRGSKDIWEGLYDFYLVESQDSLLKIEATDNDFLLDILPVSTIKNTSEIYKHILTHQNIEVRFWHIMINEGHGLQIPLDYDFYSWQEVDDLPKPILIEKYLKKHHGEFQ
ncbi:A/G-specific adenine glycosylase [Emticicia sp. BO119]|uniref:A/G-specific adenine glycosylase n=1 Tax=Emticicia sp. BO119 TaxID=2757768 RepID=UPI0015F00EC6|nr:A/G-specific adenine glycosylase [Emticicia sp. BO119]MBA4850830.1 A/G-specific adenine glycosylase [Emticicia sp. BO119]